MSASPPHRRRSLIERIADHDGLNFLLTNRIPRALATRLAGRLSRVEQPLVRDLSFWAWQRFAGPLDLEESRTRAFRSVHECFIRQLKDGARPIDASPDVLVSPCDGIVGAHGPVRAGQVLQAKGSPYALEDLLTSGDLAARHHDGCFVTLRLTSTMYHRFHAPDDLEVRGITYVAGDTWNVNPPALARVGRLFCRNERAVVDARLGRTGEPLTLVPVAAILVASLRFHFADTTLDARYRGPAVIPCRASLRRGEEMGYFQHGSTIVVFGSPAYEPCPHLREGLVVRVGRPLLRLRAGAR